MFRYRRRYYRRNRRYYRRNATGCLEAGGVLLGALISLTFNLPIKAKEAEIRQRQEARASTVSGLSSTSVSKASWQFPTSLRPSLKTLAYIAASFLGFFSPILGLFGCLFTLLPLSGATTSDGRRLTIGEGILTSLICFIPAIVLLLAAVGTWKQAAKRETRNDT